MFDETRRNQAALEVHELLFLVVLPLVGSVVVAFAALMALHWHGLHWTWMLTGIPVTWMLAFLDGSVAFCGAAATAAAILFGMLLSLIALHEGADAARRVREEIGPLHLACALVAIWRDGKFGDRFDPFVLPVDRSDSDR